MLSVHSVIRSVVVLFVVAGIALTLGVVPPPATADDPIVWPADSERRGPIMGGFDKISAGGEYSCGVRSGELWCWGRNTWGQVGTGTRTGEVEAPYRVGSRTDWTKVAAGGATTCAIRAGGALFCWGLNNRGQVGDGTRQVHLAPHRVRGDWVDVDTGWYHTCAVRRGGDMVCWGDNQFGELGRGTTRETLTRRAIRGSWRSVSVDGWTTCGIATDRSLRCWGRNVLGQVGDGTWTNRSRPTRIGGTARWLQVELSWTHACARRYDRTVWCWGRNDRGGLGDGTTIARNRPTLVRGGHEARAISTYEGGSCLVDPARELWCWGDNRYGQGSVGSNASARPITRPVRRGSDFTWVTAGWMHTCGLKGTSLQCWGANERGQLGREATYVRPAYEQQRVARLMTGLNIRLASYNILGDHLTAPYRGYDQWAPSRIRAEWTVQLMDKQGLEIIGIQEGSDIQIPAILKAAGGRLKAFPSPGIDSYHPESSILWDNTRFEALRKRVIRTISKEKRLPRPYILFRDRSTGKRFWVMNVHNPSWDRQRLRNQAVREQLERIRQLEEGGLPVFYLGDFNERKGVFCKVLRTTGLESAQGGRITRDGECIPPRGIRIDQIFGSRRVDWSDFVYNTLPLVRLTTDHSVPTVSVHIP